MRLKLLKEKIYLTDVIRDIFSKTDKSVNTSITVDVNGGITLENFKKIVDYTKDRAVIETKRKMVYIYGENLEITFCDKNYATAHGKITKIELFSKEV